MFPSLLLLLQIFTNANNPSLDQTAPTVTISSPTSSTTYDAGTSPVVSLSGTSADASGVATCRWVNALGGSGTATTSGNGDWSIASVSLGVGANVITVTCLDPGNNGGADILTVTRASSGETCGSAGCLYVDNSCGTAGNGTVDACGGATGRMTNLQTAITAAAPGKTIVVHAGSGDYVTANGSSYTNASGFAFTASGTVSDPIVLRNATGERPVLRACSSASTTLAQCNRPTITAFGQSYIQITSANCPADASTTASLGLHIYGNVVFYDDGGASESLLAIGNTVTCTEVERGWAPVDDNNWSTLFLFNQYICNLSRNYIHDVTVATLTGAGSQASRSAIKTFTGTNCTIASNTILNVGMSSASQNGIGWDCKADCVNNIFEKNLVLNVAKGWRLENQETPGGPYTADGAAGSVVHFNLFTNDGSALWECMGYEDGKITSFTFHNNTCSGFIEGLGNNNHSSGNICAGASVYNNAFYSLTDNNLKMTTPCTLALSDYNYFTTGASGNRFRYGATDYAALSNWVSGTGFDTHSTEVANASFLFTNPSIGDYTLQAGSPLQSAGKVGGLSAGAAVDVGAYTDTYPILGCNCGADSTAPTVIITAPSSSSTYDAGTSTTVAMAGTASDAFAVSSCSYTNSLGGSGSATGTTSWTIASVALTVGSNVITVTCLDTSGNQGTDIITVTRSSGGAICNGTTNICISLNSAGAANGTSCANARAFSYFNTASNWGDGGVEIDPGDTVIICGTNTVTAGVNVLAFQTSGTVGNPITLKWDTGAIIQQPYFGNGYACNNNSAAINVQGKNYVVIDGGTNGILRATASGNALANNPSASTGICVSAATGVEIKNLSILDLYVSSRNGTGTTSTTVQQLEAITGYGNTNLKIHNNVIGNCGWCIQFNWENNDTGYEIYNNEFYNYAHGLAFKNDNGVQACVTTCLLFYGNYLHDTHNWDDSVCSDHITGIHIFDVGHLGSADGVYIYNNRWGGNFGTCATGHLFVEGNSDAGRVRNFAFYNNVAINGAGTAAHTNGWWGLYSAISGTQRVVNNTIVCNDVVDNTLAFGFLDVVALTFENNVIQNCQNPVNIYTGVTITAANNNVYGKNVCGNGNCFLFGGSNKGTFAAWKAACSCDAASIQSATPGVSSTDGSLTAGSVAIGVGLNLTSIASGGLSALTSDTSYGNARTPVARPAPSTLWDIGAYVYVP